MGKIMLNGTQYGVGGIEQAKDISYDNTESGATATDVQGALDELNAGLTAEHKTIQTIQGTTIHIWKYGQFVFFSHIGILNLNTGQQYFIATLLESVKPSTPMYFTATLVNSGSVTGTARVLFNTDKNIGFVTSVAGNQEYYFSGVYLTN